MTTLTKKQKEVFDFIKNFINDNGFAPSYREIGEAFNFSSVATVASYIDYLKDKNYLEGEGYAARSLQLTPNFEESTFEVMILGTIAAGCPIEAIRTNETIAIPRDMMGRDIFALKVRGDSMMGDGIFDGDYVVIQKINNPKNGDIVVALLDGENVTLKRFYKEKNRIRLQPANGKYKPIYSRKVLVQGKVKGVIRRFK